jgi:FixJ family two-component response regulator
VPDTNRVIFVVDDEPVIAKTLAVILNQAGFQAHAFEIPKRLSLPGLRSFLSFLSATS